MNEERYRKKIESLKSINQFRCFRDIERSCGTKVLYNGTEYENLSSNDYLGLSSDVEFIEGFYASLDDREELISHFGTGAASSRLLTGNTSEYSMLEKQLAAMYRCEAALLFNSGYHANIGILPAVTAKEDLILSDKLNHASIVDGIQLSPAKTIRYRHFDYEQLEQLLIKHRDSYDEVFIVSESIFSMDGDIADLTLLADLRERYNAKLYIDEAHAFGVRGETGLGICEEQEVTDKIDFLVGTFGKAAASQGAFVVCSALMKEYLINTVRSLIFTTGLPPVTIHWLNYVLNSFSGFAERRNNLKQLSEEFNHGIRTLGYNNESESNIIPLVLGENEKTEIAAEYLQKKGYLVFPVRPPTVPKGSARLRFSLSAVTDRKTIENLLQAIKQMY